MLKTVALALAAYGLLSGPLPAQTRPAVQIEEVGLQGYYYGEPSPTRVAVQVASRNSQTQSAILRVQFRDAESPAPRIHTFARQLELRPGEQQRVVLPVLTFPARRPLLSAELRDASGKLLGQDRRVMEPALYDTLVAIVCRATPTCEAVQSDISFGGTEEERLAKGKTIRFAVLREPPEQWWAYLITHTVVLAAPVATLSEAQLSALEGYLRHGGRLVIIENELGPGAFLGAYRSSSRREGPQVVGLGKLFRTGGVKGELGVPFSQSSLMEVTRRARAYMSQQDELTWARKRLATAFVFPSVGWLLAWLGVYVLAVGLVNFALLARTGRREWGWLTVPAIALLFGAALYASSASQRPREFGLDQVTLEWMDDRSALAAAEIGLRVSASQRATLTLQIPENDVLLGRSVNNYLSFARVTMEGATEQGWDVQLGEQQAVPLKLLQWSFDDLRLDGMSRLAGTVRKAGPATLRNETGRDFEQAIYVTPESVVFLGAVAAGTDMDLAKARQEPIKNHIGRGMFSYWGYPTRLAEISGDEFSAQNRDETTNYPAMLKEWQDLPQKPFQLVELIRGWPVKQKNVFDTRSAIFLGLSKQAPAAELVGRSAAKKGFVLTIVSFEKRD